MDRIVKQNGYVYLVSGEKGFETYHNLGKDPEYWEDIERPKKKTKKKEDEK